MYALYHSLKTNEEKKMIYMCALMAQFGYGTKQVERALSASELECILHAFPPQEVSRVAHHRQNNRHV